MTPQEEGQAAVAALPKVFDAIPKGKFARVSDEAAAVELMVRKGARAIVLLDGIRKYILGTPSLGGEESPFVKQIDRILPRE